MLLLYGLPGLVLLSTEARDQYGRLETTEPPTETPDASTDSSLSEAQWANLCGIASVVLSVAAWGLLVNLGATGGRLGHQAKTVTGYACIVCAVAGLASGIVNALRGTRRVAGVIGVVLSVLSLGTFTGLFASAASLLPMQH